MINAKLPLRECDSMGCGHYGAPRGDRTHKGIDFTCPPDYEICSKIEGEVTKLGYPYRDALEFRYVEVTSSDGYRHRYFYVEPLVHVGDFVEEGDVVGKCQDVAGHWGGGMKNHVHYEIMVPGNDREWVDPKDYWE